MGKGKNTHLGAFVCSNDERVSLVFERIEQRLPIYVFITVQQIFCGLSFMP
jgi:hypothetical protein